MRKISKTALWGAVIGFVLVTVFAVGEMLGDASREQVPLPVTLILAMAMGGLLIGAPVGAILGGFVGWIRGRSEGGSPTPVDCAHTSVPPVSYSPPTQRPQPAPRLRRLPRLRPPRGSTPTPSPRPARRPSAPGWTATPRSDLPTR
ncbi:hypothetical protein CYJ76_11265 [Kytococcus schroeteri]|uniref:Uncharacterized protein n=1 Tax=Kytococcus schroeteri TaxID=138300 RepID=A0A2I1P841_9MICO|nr:hypothetical protein CYJ76_11265 [Kytococcus schroeteri]